MVYGTLRIFNCFWSLSLSSQKKRLKFMYIYKKKLTTIIMYISHEAVFRSVKYLLYQMFCFQYKNEYFWTIDLIAHAFEVTTLQVQIQKLKSYGKI